jgi:hypothetical protein
MFKECRSCGAVWADRREFLSRGDVKLVGYQVDFENPEDGLLLFNHTCESTLAVPVSAFLDMYSGPRYPEARTGTPACGGNCLKVHSLDMCNAPCMYAFARGIMQVLKVTLEQALLRDVSEQVSHIV